MSFPIAYICKQADDIRDKLDKKLIELGRTRPAGRVSCGVRKSRTPSSSSGLVSAIVSTATSVPETNAHSNIQPMMVVVPGEAGLKVASHQATTTPTALRSICQIYTKRC